MKNTEVLYEIFEQNQTKLYISKEHRFGTDSVLLGEFAANTNLTGKIIVDLCSGCGIIPILISEVCQPKTIYAVEIQESAANLIKLTVKENNLEFMTVNQNDLRDIESLKIERESVDLVTANPPYFPMNSGFARNEESQKNARHENTCKLDEVVCTSAYLLRFGGELKMCMTASRLAECIGIMQKYAIEPKQIVFIGKKRTANSDNSARLFLISGKKGAKPGVNISWK